jgi:hypothetical protein
MSVYPSSHATRRVMVGGFLVFGLLALIGCGPDYKARAVVKGKVKMGNTLLTSGTVMFHNKNGITASSPIDPHGNYMISDAPIGDCAITVTVAALPPDPSVRARLQGKGPTPGKGSDNPDGGPGIALMPEMPKNIVRIPDKFANPETSGLNYKVEKGEHVHDITF